MKSTNNFKSLFASLKKVQVYNHDQPHFLLQMGNQEQYEYIRKNRYSKFKDGDRFWAYDKATVDISFQMIQQKASTLTYITKTHFETVIAVKVEKEQEEQLSGELGKFLGNYRLEIVSSFLDVHPYEAYKKLCRYLGIKTQASDLSPFKNVSFSTQKLRTDLIYYPFLKQAREKYLNTSGLKLKTLPRKNQPTKIEIQESLQHWRDFFHLDNIRPPSHSLEEKLSWVTNTGYGQSVPIEQIVQGYGENFYHAFWSQPF